MNIITVPGTFFTGTNYWASHAGTNMWADWREDVVDDDFRRMAQEKVRVIRVFPLWPDFQPITLVYGGHAHPVEYQLHGKPLPDTDAGRAGMCEEAIAKFNRMADLAEKHGIQLIVGLITGWMSGRMFMPPALEGKNLLTDPTVMMWQNRFIKYFVNRFKDHKSILAWDLGNECNCMAPVPSRAHAYVWTAAITNAIKAADHTRLVLSGMNDLWAEDNWAIADQGEITDIINTHTYPYFTPHCDKDRIDTMRVGLHAVCETLFYSGLAGKPCFVEEAGTLGPNFANDEVACDFVRSNLFTLWAHDCRGYMWWCANEQSALEHAPYDWCNIERELGMFKLDGSPKPLLKEMAKFMDFIDDTPALPQRITDGVCILTKGQDAWGVAYSTFNLAKQAGLDIGFSHITQPIPDAPLYLLPNLTGDTYMPLRRRRELLEKVNAGAVLYISNDNGTISSFTELTGMEIVTREKSYESDTIRLSDMLGNCSAISLQPCGKKAAEPLSYTEINLAGGYRFNLEAKGAEVIAKNQNGNPAITKFAYGKGFVFFLNYPLETYVLDKPLQGEGSQPYWKIYDLLKKSISTGKLVTKTEPLLGLTEHVAGNKRIIVAINHKSEKMSTAIGIPEGWQLSSNLYGNLPSVDENSKLILDIPKHDACVFEIINS